MVAYHLTEGPARGGFTVTIVTNPYRGWSFLKEVITMGKSKSKRKQKTKAWCEIIKALGELFIGLAAVITALAQLLK